MRHVIGILIVTFFGSYLLAQNSLYIPPVITGSEIGLTLQFGETAIFEGEFTSSIGYNQSILGPTLLLNKGDEVSINVTNQITEPTTLHWHGLHVSPRNDGGPHTVIQPGETWSPSFTVLDRAATYWYHPHLHESTERQVTTGAAGLIIVRDEEEAQLLLPRQYGIDDIPLLIQSKAFDPDKQFEVETSADNMILCNATLNSYVEVPSQLVRFRLLNGSTERVFNIGLSDNSEFYQIATDGGLMPSPVSLSRLLLGPGERAEVLVNLTGLEGTNIKIISYNSELDNGYYGASNPSVMPVGTIDGYSLNNLNGNDFEIIEINVSAQTSDAITTVPSSLVEFNPYLENESSVTRELIFRSSQMGPTGMLNGPFTINGESYDTLKINETVNLGDTEIWELTNMTAIAHPFHIHDVQFNILDINGVPPPSHMQGFKDVVLVPPMGGTVRFVTRFDDFADPDVPYMYHCHMLSHEDKGMMGQFLVLSPITSNENYSTPEIKIYPNPTSEKVSITGIEEFDLSVFDNKGRLIKKVNNLFEGETIDISDLKSGSYLIEINNGVSKVVKTVIVNR